MAAKVAADAVRDLQAVRKELKIDHSKKKKKQTKKKI